MKKIILINFFVVITIIFLLEILIRLLNIVELQGYDKDVFYSENKITLAKPNSTFKVFGKISKTDKNGFRVPLDNFSYNSNNSSTLVLGDSVAFGLGVEEKDTFIGILRDNLVSNNLYNTAIFGHNLESYSYILKSNYKKFKDEINQVVIFLCLNDIVSYQGTVFEKETKVENNNFEKYIYKNTFALKLNIFLRERSELFVLLKGIFTSPIERHYNYMNLLYSNENNLEQFETNLREITDFMIKNNLKFRYILLPYAHQIRGNCKKELLKPQETIIQIFKNQNLNLKDYTSEFCKINNKNDLFLKYDPVHLSKYGHKYVSDLLISENIFN